MSDFFDTRGIPDDLAHWDALAERIATSATRRSVASDVVSLAHSRVVWGAALAVLAAAILVTTSSRDPSPMTSPSTQAFVPQDEFGRSIMADGGPPAIGSLLVPERR